MNGILNVYKESGFTSHDCVAKLRGIFRQKKIGHMGTLDPAARGVLPVALGKATRLIELFDDDKKTYRTTLLLGTVTDTLDLEGKVTAISEVNLEANDLRSAIMSFVGEQMQIPPMYSALKKNGKKLYELARAGIVIEREPRPITIYDIKIISIELPEAVFEVTCSKGTYSRSLCDDIGRKTGCGGCMKNLERINVGSFDVKNAYTLSDLQKLADEGRLNEAVLPITDIFPDMPKIAVKAAGDKAVHNGNQLQADQLAAEELPSGRFWVFDSLGSPVGIYEKKDQLYYPVKMIYEA